MESHKLGVVAEAMIGSFVGILLSGMSLFRFRLGSTVRSQIAMASLLSIGGGGILGALVAAKIRVPIGVGIAAGTGGIGLVGLLSLITAPAAQLDMAIPMNRIESFSSMGAPGALSGMVAARS